MEVGPIRIEVGPISNCGLVAVAVLNALTSQQTLDFSLFSCIEYMETFNETNH